MKRMTEYNRRICFSSRRAPIEFDRDSRGEAMERANELTNSWGYWWIEDYCDSCEAWHRDDDKPHRCERCDVCLGDGSTADHCDECAEKFDDDDDDPDWRGAGSWR